MKIDIGNGIRHFFNSTDLTLNNVNQNFINIVNDDVGESFISAAFRLNSEDVIIEMMVDDVAFLTVHVKKIKDMLKYDSGESKPLSPIAYNSKRKTLEIMFQNPITYKENITFKAKSSTTSNSRKVRSYSIFLGGF